MTYTPLCQVVDKLKIGDPLISGDLLADTIGIKYHDYVRVHSDKSFEWLFIEIGQFTAKPQPILFPHPLKFDLKINKIIIIMFEGW